MDYLRIHETGVTWLSPFTF